MMNSLIGETKSLVKMNEVSLLLRLVIGCLGGLVCFATDFLTIMEFMVFGCIVTLCISPTVSPLVKETLARSFGARTIKPFSFIIWGRVVLFPKSHEQFDPLQVIDQYSFSIFLKL